MVSVQTPLGELFVGASEAGVVASTFGEREFLEDLMVRGYEAVVLGAPRASVRIAKGAHDQLAGYFEGDLKTFEVAIDLGQQSEFSRNVLVEVASAVPFGETRTYGEIGERAGRLRAARAVGNILAGCPYSVIVPCHRVVHSPRSSDERALRGDDRRNRKAWLLQFERDRISL